MQVIGLCRFSWPGQGGFQRLPEDLAARRAALYDPARMAARLAAFESFALPALRGQTDPDFTFGVVIGPCLPRPYRARLEALLDSLPQARLLEAPPGPHRPVMQAQINRLRRRSGAPCLQFRLDDDDAVNLAFVERLRAAARGSSALRDGARHVAIDFDRGWIVQRGAQGLRLAEVRAPLWTPALGVAFAPRVQLSVMNFGHSRLARHMEVLTRPDADMFLRGHDAFNDSRGDAAALPPAGLAPPDAATAERIRRAFGVDLAAAEARCRAAMSAAQA